MNEISVHVARAHFSAVMKMVEEGEIIVVTRHGKPVMEMRSVVDLPMPRLGAFADPPGPHLEVDWTDEELQEAFGDFLGDKPLVK